MRYLGLLAGISFPSLLTGFLILEAGLRFFGYLPYYLDGQAFLPSQNPKLLYELRPGFKGLYAAVPISINSLGFRGQELLGQSDALVFRVVVVGDSIAFGQGVREGETLPEMLGVRLRQKLGSPVEVFNLGVPGYDTCQEYWRFKEQALRLDANAAVVIYVENDTDPVLFQVKNGTVISPDVRSGPVGDLMAALRKRSVAYNLVWTRWQLQKLRPSSVDEYQGVLARKFQSTNLQWRRSSKCLLDLVSLARAHHIRTIIIPFPVLRGLTEKPYPFQEYIRTVCRVAETGGAECLDVVPALQGSGIRLQVSPVEPHPSRDVFVTIAQLIGEILP